MLWGRPSAAEEIRQLSARLRQVEDPFTYARLAELLCNEGRYTEARSLCEQAIARYPHYTRVRVLMAQVAEAEGNWRRAETELRMVLRAEPHNRVGRVALGRILLERGAIAEAKEHLEYALFLSPGDTTTRELLARASTAQVIPSSTTPTSQRGAFSAGLPASPIEQALNMLAHTEGVQAVLLVDHSGLLIDMRDAETSDTGAVSAVVQHMWTLARTNMARLRLGTLRMATISGAARSFVLAPCTPGLLAIATEPLAKAGLINMRVEAARNLLANV
ncbi:MAG: tetratricopeptide repeat protein [Candidatus Zipacnadales bacterium]